MPSTDATIATVSTARAAGRFFGRGGQPGLRLAKDLQLGAFDFEALLLFQLHSFILVIKCRSLGAPPERGPFEWDPFTR